METEDNNNPLREREGSTEVEGDSIQGPHGEEESYETKEQWLGLRSQKEDSPTPKHRNNISNWSWQSEMKMKKHSGRPTKEAVFLFSPQQMKKIDALLD